MLVGLIDNSTGLESSEGRVEVYRDSMWGTVCDDNFDQNDADAACSQWGSTTQAISWMGNAFYGQGTGPIHLDSANCAPNIDSLFLCSIQFTTDCTHAEDVGVSCPTIRKFTCIYVSICNLCKHVCMEVGMYGSGCV